MLDAESKKFMDTMNKILEEKKQKGSGWIYLNEMIKEAQRALGYPEDEIRRWGWINSTASILSFDIKDNTKIDLSDFNLEEL